MKSFLFPALAAALALTASSLRADDPTVPGKGFPASHYEALWTKSPFAVATSEASADTSPDYMMVGIANVDGVSYASLIDAHNQEHFLISSDKPTRGMTLTSITRNHDDSDTYAIVQKDGQSITLKLIQPPATAAAAVPGAPAFNTIVMPNASSQLPMPGASSPYSNAGRPYTHFHHPLIHLPPPVQQSAPGQPAAAPAPAQPAPAPSHG